MTVNITTDKILKWLQLVLLVAVLGLLLWSQPWKGSGGTDTTRKITVAGEATIKAEPDEYLFTPYFEAKGTEQEPIKKDLNDKANAAVKKLKELGIEDSKIKIDSSSYDYWFFEPGQEGTLTVTVQVTVSDKAKAQEVQDYFTTLDLKGQLTPQATFSKSKQKELEAQATDEAAKDAKSKAEKQATLVGAKVGKVIEISQGSMGGYPMPMMATAESGAMARDAKLEVSALPVMAGENEFNWSVSVTYELK